MTDELDTQGTTPEDEEETTVFTLVDEETGEELQFELLAEGTVDDQRYFAMAQLDDEENYVILRAVEEDDGVTLYTIDDDDEFDRVEQFFDNLFDEVDFDS